MKKTFILLYFVLGASTSLLAQLSCSPIIIDYFVKGKVKTYKKIEVYCLINEQWVRCPTLNNGFIIYSESGFLPSIKKIYFYIDGRVFFEMNKSGIIPERYLINYKSRREYSIHQKFIKYENTVTTISLPNGFYREMVKGYKEAVRFYLENLARVD